MGMTNKLNELELKISHFLRKGVFVSAILMGIGWISYTMTHSIDFTHLGVYQPENLLVTLGKAFNTHNWGLLISYLGLFILITLPIIRVLLTGILFLKEKDYILGSIAFFVLFTLILSFILGFEV